MKLGFDNKKYVTMQSENIKRRINQFGNKLYLEFGGKLLGDYHASRVLPGFNPNTKLEMLMQINEDAEVVIVISAQDIEKNKIRSDLGISYNDDVLRLIQEYNQIGLYVSSVVITKYDGQKAADALKRRLKRKNISVYLHYVIKGYPSDVKNVISKNGFGKNEYIKTEKSLVIVTAPGPGSGKMATCLSQLYHDHLQGIKAGYAKFETFPIWNLSLDHPINLAYEAATADLADVNMIDPYHLSAYQEVTVNYNRDIEIFPVLKSMFEEIYGESPYASPTDMGVNMVGFCIEDDDVCQEASKQEIIRRYYDTLEEFANENCSIEQVNQLNLLMSKAGITKEYRKSVKVAYQTKQKKSCICAALELSDGRIITGKTSDFMGACSAVLMNTVKELAGIDDSVHLISSRAFAPIQRLKTEYLGSSNPRLHSDEILIALSLSATDSEEARLALQQLSKLKGAQAHVTSPISKVDVTTFKKLGISLTFESLIK